MERVTVHDSLSREASLIQSNIGCLHTNIKKCLEDFTRSALYLLIMSCSAGVAETPSLANQQVQQKPSIHFGDQAVLGLGAWGEVAVSARRDVAESVRAF